MTDMVETKPIRMLLVEDNPGDAKLVYEMFHHGEEALKDFKLIHVTRLSEALAQLSQEGIDVVLLDLGLPDAKEMEGVEAIHGRWPDLPIVVFSGTYEEGVGVLALQKGVQDYLVKGDVSGKYLMRAIRYAIERKRTEQALEASLEQLKASSRMKDEFVAAVSHEIRTPLTVAREGVAQVLEEVTGPIQEEQKKVLTVARESMDRLGRIINNLLDLAKLEAGKVSVKRRRVNLSEAVAQVASDLKLQARKKGLELTVSVPSEGLEVYADRDKLHQILTNLVGNALKFTQKGRIEISARESDHGIECAVSDTGMGIPPGDLPKLFQKFEQLGRTPGPGEKGTGLGLVIVKDLVELHEGTVRVESALGVGSKFFFTLPKYAAETRLQEHVRDAIEGASSKGSRISLILVALMENNAPKQRASFQALQEKLESVLKEGLCRQGDYVIPIPSGVTVILADCDREGAFKVKARCERLLKEVLAREKLVDSVKIHCGTATYPEDAQTHRELIQKARKSLPPTE